MTSRTKYWRSLEELSGTAEFERWLHAEFPAAAAEWGSEIHRRDFLRLMGASLALAGLGACTKQPIEKIVPYVKQPEELIPGKALRFATATTFAGYAQGIVVTSREGRPIKIEGNPDHPASLGATTIWAQAAVLDLYDPDRAQVVMKGETISTSARFLEELDNALAGQDPIGGEGLAILTETVTSPTVAAQMKAISQRFPKSWWYQWDPISRDALRDGRAGGEFGGETTYDFKKSRVVVALDSDFLFTHPAALRHGRDFASSRRVIDVDGARMSRLYVAEPTPSITGSNADHRLPVAAADIGAIAVELAVLVGALPRTADLPSQPGPHTSWLRGAANDLARNRGTGVIIAGEGQRGEVHALVAKINAALGNEGTTIFYSDKVEACPMAQTVGLARLTNEIKGGRVNALFILGGNPAYNAPVDLGFADALQNVNFCVHHSLHRNETSRLCHWHIPAAHFLEEWSDVRAHDGTVSIIQPLIEPIYEGMSRHELLNSLVRQPAQSSYDIVRNNWFRSNPSFETDWRRALAAGYVAGSAVPNDSASEDKGDPILWSSGEGLELVFRPDPHVWDGRYANNGWLQELPRPFTKVTWDNAALVSPKLADREKLENGDIVQLTFRGRQLNAPIWIQPGQAENSVTLHLGYGRTAAGRVGNKVGFDAYRLRTVSALWYGDGLALRKTGQKHQFASTQHHHSIEGRRMFRDGTLAEFTKNPRFALQMTEVPEENETLYDPQEWSNSGYAWGMVIDLNTCIGCSACTIACQAENNIPVVGKYQVGVGREMQWIRIDNYYAGSPDNPDFNHQPVPCMHCEHAPCELVCPVGATVHDDEGLNLQVYNRCVGTRYCSNNCPYKVRRFNFLEYNGDLSATEKLGKNPDVTVRSRGVMEKCTYCLQRINAARYDAELENRPIHDGEVVPACAQVCPTEAITFGNIRDPNGRVAALKRSPLNYGMLSELNTRPRTTYLAKLRNPSAELRT